MRPGRKGQIGQRWKGATTQFWGELLGTCWAVLLLYSRSMAGWTGPPNMVEIDSSGISLNCCAFMPLWDSLERKSNLTTCGVSTWSWRLPWSWNVSACGTTSPFFSFVYQDSLQANSAVECRKIVFYVSYSRLFYWTFELLQQINSLQETLCDPFVGF